MSLTLSGSDHSATLQALSAASSHSNNLDRLGSSRQGSMQPADADGITSSQELQHSGELARDSSAAVRAGLAGPAPGDTLQHGQEHTTCAWSSLCISDLHRSTCRIAVHVTVPEQAGTVHVVKGMAPEPQVKRKRFNSIRRALKVRSGWKMYLCAAVSATSGCNNMTVSQRCKRQQISLTWCSHHMQASRPATALAPPSAFGSGGSGVAPPAATLLRPASSSGPRARHDQVTHVAVAVTKGVSTLYASQARKYSKYLLPLAAHLVRYSKH
jgi:hypothetical protein